MLFVVIAIRLCRAVDTFALSPRLRPQITPFQRMLVCVLEKLLAIKPQTDWVWMPQRHGTLLGQEHRLLEEVKGCLPKEATPMFDG